MFPVTRSRWVTFDCFGTLVDWQAGFTAILAPLAGTKAREIVRAYFAAQRRIEQLKPHQSYKDVLVSSLIQAARDAGVSLSPGEAPSLLRSWAVLRPFADVEEMLAALRRRGYRLAVLTNCDDDLFETTHRLFAAPFDLFVTAERVRGYKPEPWHFRAFERMTGVRRRDWVHLAGGWYHDIAPARALGVKRVWLDRERSGEDPSFASSHVHTAAAAVDAIDRLLDS